MIYPKDYMPIDDFLEGKGRAADVIFDGITGAVIGTTYNQEQKLRFAKNGIKYLSVIALGLIGVLVWGRKRGTSKKIKVCN